ncbi:MAG: hypothetical protein WDW36_009136 [Sanguina aurantia]
MMSPYSVAPDAHGELRGKLTSHVLPVEEMNLNQMNIKEALFSAVAASEYTHDRSLVSVTMRASAMVERGGSAEQLLRHGGGHIPAAHMLLGPELGSPLGSNNLSRLVGGHRHAVVARPPPSLAPESLPDVHAGYREHELITCGMTPSAVISASRNLPALRTAGVTVTELLLQQQEQHQTHTTQRQQNQLQQRQRRLDAQLPTLSLLPHARSPCAPLAVTGHRGCAALRGAGYAAAELVAAGLDNAWELRAAGYSLPDLIECGMSGPELRAGGFGDPNLQPAGFLGSSLAPLHRIRADCLAPHFQGSSALEWKGPRQGRTAAFAGMPPAGAIRTEPCGPPSGPSSVGGNVSSVKDAPAAPTSHLNTHAGGATAAACVEGEASSAQLGGSTVRTGHRWSPVTT